MRRKLTRLGLLGNAIVVTALGAGPVHATPPIGFVGTTIAQGNFGPIDAFNHFVAPHGATVRFPGAFWLSWQKTVGRSDLYVQNNVWQPGGTTGWHTHPGHSLIIVTAGTVTAYEGDDEECRPRVYTVGMGFVDPGGHHVHNLRNEGAVEARTVAVQLIPAGQLRRIDAPDPGNCSF